MKANPGRSRWCSVWEQRRPPSASSIPTRGSKTLVRGRSAAHSRNQLIPFAWTLFTNKGRVKKLINFFLSQLTLSLNFSLEEALELRNVASAHSLLDDSHVAMRLDRKLSLANSDEEDNVTSGSKDQEENLDFDLDFVPPKSKLSVTKVDETVAALPSRLARSVGVFKILRFAILIIFPFF